MQNNHQQSDPVILFVKVAAKPLSYFKAKQALLEDVQGARSEAGNYKMELYEAKGHPHVFYLFERWQDWPALEAHFKQPYTAGAFDLQTNDLNAPIEMLYLADLWPLPTGWTRQSHTALTTLIVPFEVSEGNGQALVALFESFVPLVRKEPGNVEFHFHRVQGNDTLFVLYERWESPHALDAHNKRETTIELVGQVGKLLKGTVPEAVLFVRDIS